MSTRILLAVVVAWLGANSLALGATPAGCPPPSQTASPRWPGEAEWLAIEQAGLRYGTLSIDVHNVYDLANPRENVWYTRTANFLHIRTRDWVARHLLLIKPGEPVSAQQVYEAIRRLREQNFFRGADITPISCTDGVVDARVDVRDAWTLKVDTSFGRSGDTNQWRFLLVDANFLGTGRRLAIGHQKTLERSMNVLEYRSPTFLNTDWTLDAAYQNLSDGRSGSLALSKPFLLNTTPWSGAVSLLDQRLHLGFYDQGVRTWYLPQRAQWARANWQRLLNFNGVTAWRAGVAMDYERYRYGAAVPVNPGDQPPPVPFPRTLAGLGPVVSLHQDRYASYENIQGVGRAEDYNLGWDVSAQVLLHSTALGASASGPDVSVTASKGFQPFPAWLVLANGSWSARRVHGSLRNAAFNAEATAYGQPWRWQTLVFHAEYASLLRPDPENRLYTGGFQGLRGYPDFYATSTRRVQVTMADRIVTPVVWFHTFQVGFVVFTDNVTFDRGAGQGWSPWYSSVGTGLRLGNLRGATNPVLYFTVVMPLRAAAGVRQHPVFAIGSVVDF